MDDTPVRAVLGYAEESDNFVLLKPSNTVVDAIEVFASSEQKGMRLDAILITQDGSKNHLPSGIITLSDIPRLYEAIP